MDEKEKLRLEKVYSKMPDAELGEMLLCDQSGYAEGVYDLVSAEAKKRGLDEIKINEMEEKKKSELPFFWGKFIIAMGFLQGSIALIFGGMFGIETEYLPNRIVSIIIGGASLSYAYGLIERRRWGFNILMVMLYINIPICILLFILGISKDTMYIIYGIGGGLATVLNIIYFRKRKYMFTSGESHSTSASSDVSCDTAVEPQLIKEDPTKIENMQSYVTNSEAKEKNYESSDYSQKLQELKKLKDEGLLTDNEYEQKRKSIIDSM